MDQRADIWAFGAVLYEMLTGKLAFGGDDVSETLARVIEREPAWDDRRACPGGRSSGNSFWLHSHVPLPGTDAKIPISMGVSAITIASNIGGDVHALGEWTDVELQTSMRVARTALTTILAAAGVR